jgi:hypothetical protein
VPADRSVNENESLVLRRGRMILSGDATARLSTYGQFDFAGTPGTADFTFQMRDLYADVWLDRAKLWRVRVGQSKVPFGFVNMQSSQNRAAFERPEAMNLAVEAERDFGASLMWNTPAAKQRFRDLGNATIEGQRRLRRVVAGCLQWTGTQPVRSERRGARLRTGGVSVPGDESPGARAGVQAYHGRFVSPVQAITVDGVSVTPVQRPGGATDERVAVSAILYPQPFGFETEWTAGRRTRADHRLPPPRSRRPARRLHAGPLPHQERRGILVAVHAMELLRRARKFAATRRA